jgi:predicted PurR-regulated permease PerM
MEASDPDRLERVSESKTSAAEDIQTSVPLFLRVSAAVSWRFLVIVGALAVLVLLINRLAVVIIPVAIAMLLVALLSPAMSWLTRIGVPKWLAGVAVLSGGLVVVGGVLTFVVSAFTAGFPELQRNLVDSINQIRGWLIAGPLHISEDQINKALDKLTQALQKNQDMITSGALSTASTIGELLTGLALALFTLIFLLHDGRRIWTFVLRLVPRDIRNRVDVAGIRSFASLVGYVRATALVAVVDAVGIGIGLSVIGVPLVVPLAALVFLGGFVPIIGAFISGLVAVLVALVAKGFVPALLVLAVVVGVQQLEGHVLQPLLLGRAVQLHALAVVLVSDHSTATRTGSPRRRPWPSGRTVGGRARRGITGAAANDARSRGRPRPAARNTTRGPAREAPAGIRPSSRGFVPRPSPRVTRRRPPRAAVRVRSRTGWWSPLRC